MVKCLLGQSLKGIIFTPQVRQKMRKAKLGTKLSKKTKQKMSMSAKGKKKPPRSEEWKRKQRESKLGKKLSIETCLKMSNAQKGHPVSLETRDKISKREKETKRKHE